MGTKELDSETTMIVLGLGAFAAWVWWQGGISEAAKNAGAGLVNAGASAITGAVGAVGAQVDLPTPDQTSRDPAVARWIMDQPDGGQIAASEWSSAAAYLKALTMPSGSGTPPPVGSPVYAQFQGDIIDMGTGSMTGDW